MSSEGPKFNETNVYRVRRNSRLNQGLFLCKVIMKKHGSVQIEGMGETISLVSKFAQLLSKDGLGKIESISSESVSFENRNQINPKLIIRLNKTAQFDELTKDIQPKKEQVKKE